MDAVAAEKSQILFLDLALLSDHSPAASTVWQQKLIHNLLSISVQKNLVLTSPDFLYYAENIPGTAFDLSFQPVFESRKFFL